MAVTQASRSDRSLVFNFCVSRGDDDDGFGECVEDVLPTE